MILDVTSKPLGFILLETPFMIVLSLFNRYSVYLYMKTVFDIRRVGREWTENWNRLKPTVSSWTWIKKKALQNHKVGFATLVIHFVDQRTFFTSPSVLSQLLINLHRTFWELKCHYPFQSLMQLSWLSSVISLGSNFVTFALQTRHL